MKNKINAIAQQYLEYNGKSFRHPQGLAVSITEDEGQFMYDFIKKHDLTTGFEIGTGTGYSGLWFSAALRRFCTVDNHSENKNKTVCHEDAAAMLQELKGADYLIFGGTSPTDIDVAVKIHNMKNIDFVFIDGNHDGDFPAQDFLGINPFMAKKAVIFWHDSDCAKQAMEEAVKKEFTAPVECDVKNTYGLAFQTRGFSDS